MTYIDRAILTFDGASRHNPHGPAGCGYSIRYMDCDGAEGGYVVEGYEYLGYNVSCNQAEYHGLINGLRMVEDNLDVDRLYVRGDSEIVIKQLNGEYQVRSPNIYPLYEEADQLLGGLNIYEYTARHIRRDKNWRADDLANMAIDEEDDGTIWY
jgi:ribonuclease HI